MRCPASGRYVKKRYRLPWNGKVDYRDEVRRYFYRDMLLPRYIIDGKTIKLIVDPFDEENHDEEKEFLKNCGFETVGTEGKYYGYQ